MKKIFFLVLVPLLMLACQKTEAPQSSKNDFSPVLEKASFKIADTPDELKTRIAKTTNLHVNSIENVTHKKINDDFEFIEVVFKTNKTMKNIMYIKTSKDLKIDGVVKFREGDLNSKGYDTPVVTVYCDDCPDCSVMIYSNGTLACSESCCSMYISSSTNTTEKGIKIDRTLKELPFKIADNVDELKNNISSITNYEIEKITSLENHNMIKNKNFVEVKFLTVDKEEKNILYVYDNESSTKNNPVVTKYWCADCNSNCRVMWNNNSGYIYCSASCCKLHSSGPAR